MVLKPSLTCTDPKPVSSRGGMLEIFNMISQRKGWGTWQILGNYAMCYTLYTFFTQSALKCVYVMEGVKENEM